MEGVLMKRKTDIINRFFRGSVFLKLLSVSAFIALLDLVFKSAVDTEPDENFPREMPHTGGRIKIFKKHNPGFAMGFLREFPEAVKLIHAFMCAAIMGRLQFMSKLKGRRIEKAGLAVALGGALSNLSDRLFRGYVVDYICINKGFLKKLVVNIGDIAIVAGGVTAAVGSLLSDLVKK